MSPSLQGAVPVSEVHHRPHPQRRWTGAALALVLAATPPVLAARDTGSVSNWDAFSRQVKAGTVLLPLTTPNSPEVIVARGQMLSNGRFVVDLREDVAARLATNDPQCAGVRKSPTMRTLFINALVTSGTNGLYALQRTALTNTGNLIDGWLYASERGSINGTCTVGNVTGSYALNLNAGWNVVRLSLNATRGSLLTNAPSRTIPWTMKGQ